MKIALLNIVFFFLFIGLESSAQSGFFLLTPSDSVKVLEAEISFELGPEAMVLALQKEGYLEANIDSVWLQDSLQVMDFHIGPKYEWLTLEVDSVTALSLQANGLDRWNPKGKKVDLARLNKIEETLLTYAENNGHPFAKVGLKDVVVDSGKVAAQLLLDKGALFSFDSLRVLGSATVNKRFIQNFTNIKTNSVYDESKVLDGQKRLRGLPFLNPFKQATVSFVGEKALVTYYLEKKKASQFDVLLGFLSKENQAPQISGEAKINLANPFGQGASYLLHYKSYPDQATELTTAVNFPFLPGLPVGAGGLFELYVRDTSYRNLRYKIDFSYNLNGRQGLTFFFEQLTNRLISIDENRLIQTKSLPKELDTDHRFYGIGYYFQDLDYPFNPRKGWRLHFTAAYGQRKLIRNIGILALSDPNDADLSFEDLYAQLNEQNGQLKTELTLERYWKLGKQSTFRNALQLGFLRNLNTDLNQEIFENERYRIGGTLLLRGFDEQSIFADWYNVLTSEFRYLIGANAHFLVFNDFAYITNQQDVDDPNYWAYSFGAGMRFETKGGIFSLSYALGAQRENPIIVQNGKIHLGYVNLF